MQVSTHPWKKLRLIPLLILWPCLVEAGEGPVSRNVNPVILQGIERLYDGETDRAEELFRAMTAENPTDPAGHFYMAMVSWSRLAMGFWFSDVVNQYIERIDRAISAANALIEQKKADSYTYFYLGGALGFKGRFYLMEHKWVSSFFLALDAIEALKTCQALNPDNKDVYLGLGMFDYYTAKLSGVLKFLTYLFLHRGNIEEGLRKLHVAAQEATYSSVEAKSMLLHIYLFMEQDHHKALPLAKELAERFRRYPRYKFLEGTTYLRLRMNSGYREVLDLMRTTAKLEKSPIRGTIWYRQCLYLETSHALFGKEYEEARSRLDRILAISDPQEDPYMIAWPILKKGMSYDLEGKRDKALEHYRRVMEMKNGAGAQFLAEKYATEPMKSNDPFIGY